MSMPMNMIAPPNAPEEKKPWNTRGPLSLGFIALGLLVVGIGGWSVLSNIAGAIVASGLIEVESNRQIVQHPEGGVIGAILVDDGQTVVSGEVLVRFDDTLLQSEINVTTEQLFEVIARKARLIAERDGLDEVAYSPDTLAEMDDPIYAELVTGQNNLFFARRDSLERERALLAERKAQIEQQIVGAEAQVTALVAQQNLIAEELVDEEELLSKGLSQLTKARSLRREAARMEGQMGGLMASIAESRGRIAEIEIEILRLTSTRREEAISTLRDLQFREIELRERKSSLLETLSRMEITAPTSGVIYGLQFHTERAVVRPADPILYIVPQDSPLVIATKIPAIHIDQVHIGQEAKLRFSAFDMRTTPEILGEVTKISPDIFTDEATGATFYTAEILPYDDEMPKLDGLDILPGMPVEAFIKTDERTPLQYLIKPLADYFNKAFREG